MIRVTVELLKHGDPTQIETLGTAFITNNGTGSPTLGNYKVILTDKAGNNWRRGYVKDFPRKRLLAWDLLFQSLRNALGDRGASYEKE